MAENTNEPAPYVPFVERITSAEEEGRASIAARQRSTHSGPKVELPPHELELAQALVRLQENPDFKTYLEAEAMEMSDRYVTAFNPPPKNQFASESFAEQMAYNKGRCDQMKYIAAFRNQLLNTYLNMARREREGGENG